MPKHLNVVDNYNRAHTHHYDSHNETITLGCPYELQTLIALLLLETTPEMIKKVIQVSSLKLITVADALVDYNERSVLAHFTNLAYSENNGKIIFNTPIKPDFTYLSPFSNRVSLYRVKNCLSLDGYAIYYDVMRLLLVEGVTQGHLKFYTDDSQLLSHTIEDQEALSQELFKIDLLAFSSYVESNNIQTLSDLRVIRRDAIWQEIDELGEETLIEADKTIFTCHGVLFDSLIKETMWDRLTEDSLVHYSPQMAYRHKSTSLNLYRPHFLSKDK